MRCTPFAGGFVCGPAPRAKNCSTPGCRRAGKLACDFPLGTARAWLKERAPARGDARLHKLHQLIFYVWQVSLDEAGSVTVSQSSPDGREMRFPKVVSFEEWFTKTEPTCDRPVCDKCAGHRGSLDLCGAHARAHFPEPA